MYLKKELYELVRTNESIFDFIQEGSLDGLWYWDLENPENEWMNARFWTVLGYDPDEMPHKSSAWQSIINQEDLKVATENFVKHCQNPDHPYDQVVRYTHKNGSTKWMRCRGIAIRDDKGKPTRMLGAHQDISEIKNSEAALLHAKKAAEESERKLRRAFDNSPLPTAIAGVDGTVIYLNKQFIETYGYTIQDIPFVEKWYEMAYPDPQYRKATLEDWNREVEESIEKGLPTRIKEYQVTCKNGEVKSVAVSGYFEKEIIVGLFQDITERKLAEQLLQEKSEEIESQNEEMAVQNEELIQVNLELQAAKQKAEESEERFNLAMRASNDGIFDWNLETNEIYYSPAWKKMLGYEEHELPNDFSVWEQTTDPDDVKKSWELQQKLITKQTDRFVLEFKMKHKEGHWIDVLSQAEAVFDANGKAVRIVGTHTDITKRKRAERALKESEQRFRSLVNTINSGVAFYRVINEGQSGSDYIIQSFNDFALKHEGLGEKDVIGKSLKEIRPEIDDYGLINIFREVWKTGTPAFYPAKLYIDEKYSNYYENRVFKISTDEIVAVYDDVTEKERAQIALKEALGKAQESDRLKSAFLANMSHEIRTPMNGILGFAELLKKPDLTGHEQQKYISIIEKSGTRMLNIINDIIDISKIEAGLMEFDIKKTNINEQIEDIYSFFKPEAEAKGIKLAYHTSLREKEATISTDKEKLYAILTNLVKNAIKYTDKGSIELGYVLVTDDVRNELEFYVKDTGMGIPEDRHKAIFERFIQSDIDDKMAHQGAGLGLAISKTYVERLGGEIWVESDPGGASEHNGSTFCFTLPYNSDSVNKDMESHPELKMKDTLIRKLKILIAEDDEVSGMLLEEALSKICKSLIKVKTGVEAVEACRNNPDIDLILMDIRMPEMGGYRATKQIREFNKEVIIIAQTAHGLSGDREKAIEAGCSDYIAKPIKQKELLALIQKHFVV